jgi:hypothetical protein
LSEAVRLPVDDTAALKRPRGLLVALILATLAGVALAVTSVPFLMFSFLMFDAGETAEAWIGFFAMWSMPLLLLAGLAVAWIAFGARLYWLVWVGFALTVLPLVVIYLFLA